MRELPELAELQGRGAWQQHTEEKHRGQLGGAHCYFAGLPALGFGLWRNYLEVRRRSLQVGAAAVSRLCRRHDGAAAVSAAAVSQYMYCRGADAVSVR